ncbi:glycosyltransferase involved in cell wall biosynthesis [Elizabethkingia sp. YR214]|uniref:glycosyltransferase family 4 protein n=1 Tax=Elizabethkingia sp. YR214 TaxID=2135667 RepID=UPI000D31789B|nr:glycosyltransferase family 4 protein [Elizabethkingia sp. YR214]PUB28539.1 glycosyltransferase involved in cell wall biosynthesis [Elizabethkingia sp. YR214]
MENIWIATELFYPEETSTSYILTKISNKLSSKYKVNVVCGAPVYDKRSEDETSFTIDKRVNIKRIEGFEGNKNSLLSRVLRFFYLSFSMFFYLLKNVKRGEKIFIVTNPAPLILLVTILKKIKKTEVIILVHDVFPENTIPSGIIKSEKGIIYRVIKKIFDKAYSKADTLIVLGRDMKEIVQRKIKNTKAKIIIIENWADIDDIFPVPKDNVIDYKSPLRNKIVFQYAGNIGRVQGLLELLDIIKQIENERLAFYFIGEGAVKEEMQNFVRINKLNNVFFSGAYSRSEQKTILNKCDVAFVSLAEGMLGLGVPSKAYNILAAGKPILYIGDKRSEISMLINEEDIGYTFEPKDKTALIVFFNNFNNDIIEDLQRKKDKARKTAVNKFSEEIILNKFYDII